MIDSDSGKLARIFRVLSADTRVRLIDLLKCRSLCVNALARVLKITPAAVSQHLRVLRDAGIVEAAKQGYFVHYRVNETTLADWNAAVRSLLETDEDKTDCSCCQRPEEWKDKPQDCSPEQIQKCHGDVGQHPCLPEKETRPPETGA